MELAKEQKKTMTKVNEVQDSSKKPLLDGLVSYLNELAEKSGSPNYATITQHVYYADKGSDVSIGIYDLLAKYPNGKEYSIIRITNDVVKDQTYDFERSSVNGILGALLFQKDEVRLIDVLTGNIDGIKDEV